MMVLVSLLELFSVFHLLSNILRIMITEMGMFGSFEIRTLGLSSEITGSPHSCLSFLIAYSIFKSWDSTCPI